MDGGAITESSPREDGGGRAEYIAGGDSREHITWQKMAAEVLDIERDALAETRDSLDDNFSRAVEILRAARGKIVCSGVGKSGHIAGKIAATFSSTGAPAIFMHPADAGHGDLGVVADEDAVLLISYSGESGELLELIPPLKRLQVPLLAIVGAADSTLAAAADVALSAAVRREACPHNLAPTASTTAALALGDALAMVLLRARGFSPDDFARTHPAGKLGRRLLLRVADIMRAGADIPRVRRGAALAEALLEMTGKRMGMTLVCEADGALCGIFTDGDLRRAVNSPADLRAATIDALMTPAPKCAPPAMLAADALAQMKAAAVNHLAVVDAAGKLVGALSLHDILRHKLL